MEDLPQVPVAQQLKSMMHTSHQSKQKLGKITSILDTQVVATTKITIEIQVTIADTYVGDDQAS